MSASENGTSEGKLLWRNRPIEHLETSELRAALLELSQDLFQAHRKASADQLFRAIIVSFLVGALTPVIAAVLGFLFR